ncbi:hypothetical protein [Salmonella enterica]|uniref:Uncharacterized protein n=1 Tax=Salmonella enterica subsp. diarizonae serovar 60:r:e,n,x,z15 TaxID=1173779 RepID=A0A8E9Y962_SALDZ|nr:hypothetical protein [Salmonella enterica]OHF67752.1 hypothetical protein A7S96_06055 [Salmonella enterica subsp. diarizonae serovar 60:r:e,n,x,z15]OHF72162.1 hypothetical protein A7T04_02675 [Salmonella enterica subsp. diarizonae serovar 60:r:e,n,x,z15]OHF76631.1 hypothetical protein A7T09_02675 [Salmonella enterica subsp. diarizonae serovar 60:r:e,n,x,z15]OHF80731.1 hypothetical protein A7T26_00470 [Salmonella enterica subsp. diarizonae serovar 60:r:e,n,x,z15]OHF90281.1 hypothetical prote
MNNTEKLMAVGKLVYGDNWQSPISRDIGVDSRTIRYVLKGEREINHLSSRLKEALEQKAEKLKSAIEIINSDKMSGDDVDVDIISNIVDGYEYSDEQYKKTAFDEINNAVCADTWLSDLDSIARKWSKY